MSQWSLTFEVRKRRVGHRRRVRHGGGSQWSLTFEVRKSGKHLGPAQPKSGSQWSLTFEVRKSLCQSRKPTNRQVAMEPDL